MKNEIFKLILLFNKSYTVNRVQKCIKSGIFTLFIIFCLGNLYANKPEPAAWQTEKYVGQLKGKKVGLVVNQTSMVGQTHLVDTLRSLGVKVQKVFAPEHGFRGDHSAGAAVKDGTDQKTGLPLISLYGNNKKPTPEQLKGLDWVVFDIQDVGVRFYTYISTMHLVMEACAESGIPMMILDRPNPNGHFVDGPVLKKGFESFVGMHPIPVVHGLTVAELAQMINGEGWLKNGIQCDLALLLCKNYVHSDEYHLPYRPSPNLPNQLSVMYYPGLCFFEGTIVSVGRGTDFPFQLFGFPGWQKAPDTFKPQSIPGVADNPPQLGVICKGYDLSMVNPKSVFSKAELNLNWLLLAYQAYPVKSKFFNNFFDKLAGNSQLREQIIAGKTMSEIRKSWETDLLHYMEMRQKYLLYGL